MDEQIQTSVLYKSRGFSGRLSAGFKFIEKNFKQILRVSIVGIAPIALLGAMLIICFPLQKMSLTASLAVSALWLVLELVAVLYSQSLIYSMLEKYGELGYVPNLKIKDWWKLMKKKVRKVFSFNLFLLVFSMIVGAIFSVLLVCFFLNASSSLSMVGGLLLLFFFIGFLFICVPMFLMPNFYILGAEKLGQAFKSSFKYGIPNWGSTFGILLFTFILSSIISIIGSLPYCITELIEYLMALSAEDGNVATLPFYYTAMRVLFAFIAFVITYYSSLLVLVPMTFQYASLVTMKKEQELEVREE